MTIDHNSEDDNQISKGQISNGMKTLLEMGPLIAFFIGYLLVKDMSFDVMGETYNGFILITAAFIPVIALSTFILWRLTGKLAMMQIVTLVLVTVFGGLTVWLNDERFFKMKPTIIYLLFTAILAFGLFQGKSFLKLVMGEVMPLREAGWMILTKRVCVIFLVMAVMNEVVWRLFSTDAWVNFKTFGLPILMFIFFMSQSKLVATYSIETDKTDENDSV